MDGVLGLQSAGDLELFIPNIIWRCRELRRFLHICIGGSMNSAQQYVVMRENLWINPDTDIRMINLIKFYPNVT